MRRANSTEVGNGTTRFAGVILLEAAMLAAMVAAPEAEPRYASAKIDGVPHIQQKPDFCGEACVAMALRKLGHTVDQDYVFDQSGLDPLLGRGCFTRDLAGALEKIGFKAGPVWYSVSSQHAEAELEALWAKVHADLAAGVPAILCMHYDKRPTTTEHFRLVLGYDATTDEVLYHEPAEADGAYRRMPRRLLLELWPLKYRADRWTVIWMRLVPGQLRAGRVAATFSPADYAQHMMLLRPRIPDGFTVVIEPPLLVIGDESPEMVRHRSKATVRWAVDRLKAAYFRKDPRHIIDIWLFADAASYQRHSQAIFHHEPTTPYGFFLSGERALVMDISTGGGTLVHEIVHPFVEANFPACPAWFNEGLGSLYEQSAERDGQIVGLTNWRLAGLQAAIRAGRLPSFAQLCATSDTDFYQADPGTNYAQARYLCYDLQQRGLLRKFYADFRASAADDPTGYATLQAVLGHPDMAAYQQEWKKTVLGLTFP